MKRLLALLLCMILLLCGCGKLMTPPSAEVMEAVFQTYRAEIGQITEYLLTQDAPVSIHNSQNLPEDISRAVKTLIKKEGCHSIHYSGNTVHFVLWTRFTDAGGGIAYRIANTLEEDLPYLIQLEPLSEPDWYYYVEDINGEN